MLKTRALKKCKLKKGDEVIVIAGKNKGQKSTIDKVDYKKGKVYLTNVNVYKKHQKPTSQNQLGGIIEKVLPIDISNIMLLDPKTKTPTRIGYKIEGNKKVRYAKKSGTILN